MRIELTSFGFRHGVPKAETVFDVRCLDNPIYVESLRNLCGLDTEVQRFLLVDSQEGHAVAQTLLKLLLMQATLYDRKPASHAAPPESLHVAIGCTGGQHRSVAVTEYLSKGLRARGHIVRVVHRDLSPEFQ